jgi:hypothetical protein
MLDATALTGRPPIRTQDPLHGLSVTGSRTLSRTDRSVCIATLAWTIYNDLRKKTPRPAPDVAARTLRVELRRHTDGTPDSDKVTEVVVAEIVGGAGGTPEE